MTKDNRYKNYTQLLEKVDGMFAAVRARHESRFSCGAGCYGCCQAGLSFSGVEASRIRDYLESHPEVAAGIKDGSKMLRDPDHCALLDIEGRCSIYDVRPLICRSHGLPVSWESPDSEQEKGEIRDVCPLNFEGVDLDGLPRDDVLSLDKLNILLSLINRQFDADHADERISVEELIENLRR